MFINRALPFPLNRARGRRGGGPVELPEPAYLFRYADGTFTRSTEASWFDPETGELTWWAAGLLRETAIRTPDNGPYFALEESRTNRIVHSEALATAPWTATSATVTADAGAAPDGEADADQVAFAAGGAVAQPLQTIPADGARVAMSAFVKLVSGSGTVRIEALLKDGTVATGTAITPTATWQRIVWTAAIGTGVTTPELRIRAATGAPTVLVWGAQAEDGVFPTSYIRTAATAATRAADHLVIPAAAIPAAFLTGKFDVYARPSFSDVDIGGGALGNLAIFWSSTGNHGLLAFRQAGGGGTINIFSASNWATGQDALFWARGEEFRARVQHDILAAAFYQNGVHTSDVAPGTTWATATAGFTVGRNGLSAANYATGLIAEPTAVAA